MLPANKPPATAGGSPTPPVKGQQSLSLELPVVKTAGSTHTPAAIATGATPVTRLWLCIYLPALALEALHRDNEGIARAVFDDQDGIPKVLLASDAAKAAGVRAGFSVNAALALLPTLELEQRDLQCERRTLLSLAGWAEQFTSFVVIEAPGVLLLELAGSVRLFDGLH